MKMHKNAINLAGMKFGKLTAISPEKSLYNKVRWVCVCECGNRHVVSTTHLRNGSSKSCGCFRKEFRVTHGMSRHPAYETWKSMIQRCTNKNASNWSRYGGRGITVCKKWRVSFYNFWLDMGESWEEGLSIDRINNSGNYKKNNCKWSTRSEQQSNRRANVILDTPWGKITLSEAARKSGIARNTIDKRIKNGWDHVRAVTVLPDKKYSTNATGANQ